MGPYVGPDPYVHCEHCGESHFRNQSPRWATRNWWQLQSMGDSPVIYEFCSAQCLAAWLKAHALPVQA